MKKFIAVLIALFMLSSIAYAVKLTSSPKSKTKTTVTATVEAKEKAKEKAQAKKEEKVAKAKSMKEVKKMSEDKKKELDKELEGKGAAEREVLGKQNRVRIAVHTLLAMEGMEGGIGPEVSKIARDFNNSSKKTEASEIKIKEKSPFYRFFTGGEKESAQVLLAEVKSNEERIAKLKKLRDKISPKKKEIRDKISEQINIIGEEQSRLAKLAESESKARGLFGK